MLNEILKKDIAKCVQTNELSFYYWDRHLPNGSLMYKQLDSNVLGVQVFIADRPDIGGFLAYEKIKNELISLFQNHDLYLDEEITKPTKQGWFRELRFMKEAAYRQKLLKRQAMEHMAVRPTYQIGTIYAQGGNMVFGDVINSTLSIDTSTVHIREMIEERGGEDKQELDLILSEFKKIAEQMIATGQVVSNPSLKERFSNHLAKHGWFYGEILGLIGSVAIKLSLGI